MSQIKIKIRRERGIWIAEIMGGWWVGHGSTRAKAIKKAIDNFEHENDLQLADTKMTILANEKT